MNAYLKLPLLLPLFMAAKSICGKEWKVNDEQRIGVAYKPCSRAGVLNANESRVPHKTHIKGLRAVFLLKYEKKLVIFGTLAHF